MDYELKKFLRVMILSALAMLTILIMASIVRNAIVRAASMMM